jgi:hypothetical protein
MPELTNSDFDRLALDACETIGYQGGRVAAYDVAGYDRIMRRESPPAQVQYRELPSAQKGFLPKPASSARTCMGRTRLGLYSVNWELPGMTGLETACMSLC